ncbi:Methyltransferase domain-containing protein [Lentzea xinjiangensis]|uniref:Methyltransferase domain-containing protein n=1 Tax=Lentzea xinjiangensis TaxID=402600 RepID=A0A1H9VVZ7_9PSEU|nr:class I SAM-dependent methyltransferase [Lentzea xinjiangensis]SES25926.1 Methyltransferase domain-containing protein [Lentzea xinjiangensis]
MSAAHFDRWYTDRSESPVADDLVRRVLGLPPDLRSTSLLDGAGLDEVVALLDLRPGQVLLDLACGRGGYGLEIARRTGCRLVGVDFSAVAIEQARERARTRESGAEFRVGTLTETGLETASADAVLVVDAMQFADPTVEALRECRRVLVPGGRLVITCWEPVVRRDERLSARLLRMDFAAQLPQAGFVGVDVVERPAWQAVEKRMWEEVLAVDAPDDPAIRSLQEEARSVLPAFDLRRRVLATAFAPR